VFFFKCKCSLNTTSKKGIIAHCAIIVRYTFSQSQPLFKQYCAIICSHNPLHCNTILLTLTISCED